VGVDGVDEGFVDRSALLAAGRDQGPDALAPLLAAPAAGGLGDAPVDHHEADRLLGEVVGRLDAGRGDKAEIRLTVVAKTLGDVLRFGRVRHAMGRTFEDRIAGLVSSASNPASLIVSF